MDAGSFAFSPGMRLKISVMTENTAKTVNIPIARATLSAQADCGDHRYRRLLGEAQWRHLLPETQARFAKQIALDEVVVYRGEVVLMELSRMGQLLGQLARLVGGPLPYTSGATGPSVVAVSEAPALGGQIWTRSYSRPGRFPQVIHSAKRFSGPTGLEECLGRGIVMRLTLHAEGTTLVFRSAGYALELLGRAIPLPRWLSPGNCEIRHRPETDGRFSFTLTLDHPLLGRLVHQVAFFEEA